MIKWFYFKEYGLEITTVQFDHRFMEISTSIVIENIDTMIQNSIFSNLVLATCSKLRTFDFKAPDFFKFCFRSSKLFIIIKLTEYRFK